MAKKKFKFKPMHYGMKCSVPYVYPLTIIGYLEDQKLVIVTYSNGQYDHSKFYIPEADINIDPSQIPTKKSKK